MVDHREIAFESAVEHSLLTSGGYEKGNPAQYDRTRALHPHLVLGFVQSTQPKSWQAIAAYYGNSAADAFLAELTLALDTRGTLDVLRHGLDFFGQTFHLAYFAPASGLNPGEFRLLSGWSGFCGVRGLARGKRIGCRARANCLRQQGI